MPLFKFKVSWQDDDNIQRDIEILSRHSFMDFHNSIKKSYGIKDDVHASFFVSNEYWEKGQEINSAVEKNIKGATALSCTRTPIGALVTKPNQNFLYITANDKAWVFLVELIIITKETGNEKDLPRHTRSEGLSPADLTVERKSKETMLDTEEKYDLGDKDGFGDEDEDGNPLGSDDSSDDYGDEFGGGFDDDAN